MATMVTDPATYLTGEEIERRAAEVLQKYTLDRIPVDLVELANRLGILVHNAKFFNDTLVGMIAKRGAAITMLVNADAPPFRKLFTIAHELGHYFLHLSNDGEYVDEEMNLFRNATKEGQSLTPEHGREIEANRFAVALLMPERAVRGLWPQWRKIETMARLFNVSEAAMGIRITQLGLA